MYINSTDKPLDTRYIPFPKQDKTNKMENEKEKKQAEENPKIQLKSLF